MRRVILAGLVWSAVAVATAPAAQVGGGSQKPLPSFDQVRQVVGRQLATLADYKSGDLISQKQVEPIFGELQRLSWTVADRAEILKLVPRDDEFIVKQLRTADGKKFMRQSDKYQGAYDRIDRLSHMIMGEKNVKALIEGPDGYKMIQYMTTTPYGRNLGQMLSQDPGAGKFNAPTGRLYTGSALIARLAQSYKAEQSKRQAGVQR